MRLWLTLEYNLFPHCNHGRRGQIHQPNTRKGPYIQVSLCLIRFAVSALNRHDLSSKTTASRHLTGQEQIACQCIHYLSRALTMFQDNSVRLCTDGIPASKEHGTRGICGQAEKPRGCDERREKMWVCGSSVSLALRSTLVSDGQKRGELVFESRGHEAHLDKTKSVKQRLPFPIILRCSAVLCCQRVFKRKRICWHSWHCVNCKI